MLKVIGVEQDGHTGHITVHSRIVEQVGPNQTIEGQIETHGIHPSELDRMYEGDEMRWLDNLHKDMQDRHCARGACYSKIKNLQGKTLFKNEETNERNNEA